MATGGLFEFGRVFLEAVSRPLARSLTGYARSHKKFAQACVVGGNFMNSWYVRFSHLKSGANTKIRIKPLDEERATSLGAKLLSEAIVVAVALSTLLVELELRRRRSELRAAELKAKDDDIHLKMQRQYCHVRDDLDSMRQELQSLRALVETLQPPPK